jgi:hypothetical protein
MGVVALVYQIDQSKFFRVLSDFNEFHVSYSLISKAAKISIPHIIIKVQIQDHKIKLASILFTFKDLKD